MQSVLKQQMESPFYRACKYFDQYYLLRVGTTTLITYYRLHLKEYTYLIPYQDRYKNELSQNTLLVAKKKI